MKDITVLSYCHMAHRHWIPHWVKQLNEQTSQEFSILFICHNWQPNKSDFIEFKKLHPKIYNNFRYIIFNSEPKIGLVINHGASLIETKWLAHLDLDDIIHPKRIELQSKFINEHPEIDFINARCIGFNSNKPPSYDLYYHDTSTPLLAYLTNPKLNTNEQIRECFNKGYNCLAHGLMIYKPETLQQLGGFSLSDVKTDGLSPDFQTWIKAINAGYQFYRLPELLMGWRLDSSSIRI